MQTIAFGLLCWNAAALLAESNGYIRVDCYGGLNQMRRDVSIPNILAVQLEMHSLVLQNVRATEADV